MAKQDNEMIYITFALDNSVIGFKSTLVPDVVNRPYKDPICLPHHHFDDWYEAVTGDTKFDFTDIIDDNVTIYGRSKINNNAVEYFAGEGTGFVVDANSPYDYVETVTVLEADDLTPPVGKVFDHWQMTYMGDKIPYTYDEYEIIVRDVEPGDVFRMPDSKVELVAIYKDE